MCSPLNLWVWKLKNPISLHQIRLISHSNEGLLSCFLGSTIVFTVSGVEISCAYLGLWIRSWVNSVWRWRRFGMKEERKQRNGVNLQRKLWAWNVFIFYYFFRLYCFFKLWVCELWRGVVSLAGVKHWFYASSKPNVFSLKIDNS